MDLLPIPQSGELPKGIALDEFIQPVMEATVKWYERVGFNPPWMGYLALQNGQVVGACGFKTAPMAGRVEIAYGTRPGFEGQGVATRMAAELIRLAQEHDPKVQVFAQTLPQESASTSLLKKLGFQYIGSVLHPEDGTVWEWELAGGSALMPSA